MTMLVRKRQLAAKIEGVEGSPEILSASDGGILVNFTPKASYEPQMYQRNPVRSSLTNMGKLTGKRSAGLEFAIELKGSGNIANEPKWANLIRACGFESNDLKKIAIGSITDGPFKNGETIIGGTSGAEGRVVMETEDGTAVLYYVPLSGDLQDVETITGSVSTASAITGSVPEDAGREIKPISTGVPSLTLGLYEDGIRKLIKGARGTVKFNFKIGEPVIANFNFMGVESGVTDASMLSGVSFDDVLPPVLLNAIMSVDNSSLNIGEMEIDIANTLASKDKIDDAKGILSYMITGRDVQGSFNPEMVSVATHDFFTKWFNNNPVKLDMLYGQNTGNSFRFYAPKLVYSKVDDGERDGIQLAQTSFDLTGSMEPGDDELALLLL